MAAIIAVKWGLTGDRRLRGERHQNHREWRNGHGQLAARGMVGRVYESVA